MKLKDIISRIENEGQFTSKDYDCVLERKTQLRTYYRNCQMIMVFDNITNNGFIFYIVDVDQMDELINKISMDNCQKEIIYSNIQPI